MKRLILPLIVYLPISLIAQQADWSRMKDPPGPSAVQDISSAEGSADTSLTSIASGILPHSASESEADPQPAPKNNSTKARKKKKPVRLPIEGSMVGYVDDAIVGSQLRIRFDAGFHDNAPDRAEFFYAQYAGLNGPGPNSVVADLNFQQFYATAEYALQKRISFFAELPVRWIQPQSIAANVIPTSPLTNQAGLSDIAAGFKLAAIASSNQFLTFQLQSRFPSGSASAGLGTHHYSVEPALLYYRRLSDRMAVEGQLGDSHPIGGSSCTPSVCGTPNTQGFAGDVFFYGVGPSYVAYRSANVRIAPVIELVGWRVLGGLETECVPGVANCANQVAVSADGDNIVNLKAGARTMVGAHSSFYIGYGHQLTHAVWYKEIVRAEYRYSF
jgi:hypothetical protein